MKWTLQNIIPTYSISNSLFSLAYLFFFLMPTFSSFTLFLIFFGWTSSISIAIVLNLKEKKREVQYVYIFCIVFIICLFILAQKIMVYNKLGYHTIIYNYMGKDVYIAMCVVFQKYMLSKQCECENLCM
jgi:energy-converting hydrogenase Eha subunit A